MHIYILLHSLIPSKESPSGISPLVSGHLGAEIEQVVLRFYRMFTLARSVRMCIFCCLVWIIYFPLPFNGHLLPDIYRHIYLF